MGYTIYMKTQSAMPAEKIKPFLADVRKVLSNPRMPKVVYEYDEPEKKPCITASEVRFNGPGEWGCETFLLLLNQADRSFCKTNRRPYTSAVFAVLLLADHHAPGWCEWDRDGDDPSMDLSNEVVKSVIKPEKPQKASRAAKSPLIATPTPTGQLGW